ncbi:LysE family transporter [Qaidamihabitans albus]|uniref:LysE family transporter n=1 Tax=Qaidamihabitans albus TaxID=2795733 RepID=UPI0018F121A0|nr:LysE family transporter [Qaidamihabitans albus]
MTAALLAGLLAGYGIAIPVGAVGAYLVALTARTSLRVGACAALGVAVADGLYALVAVLGGSALAGLIAPAAVPLRWAAAAVLVTLAALTAARAIRQHRTPADGGIPADRVSAPRAFAALLGITLLNPATVVYFAALVIGDHATVARSGATAAVFVAAAFAASASWQLLLAGGGALLGRAVTGPRGRLATALASSVLITVLAAHLLVSA